MRIGLERSARWCLAALLTTATLVAAGPDAKLANAAEAADWAAVSALLEQDIDANAAQVDGMTALHWAAYHDRLEAAKALLAAGADALAANRYGVTALSLACQNGDGALVELLLAAGADPNTALPGGETVLMTAARTGKLAPVKALLKAGADVNAADSEQGQTALMWAAAEGHAEVVETLLAAGADLDARVESGFTPLLFAVREGRIAAVDSLLRAGADVNSAIHPSGRVRRAPSRGTSALLLAVMNAHFELAARLLEAGADPNADATGYTPLHAIVPVRKPGVGDNDPAPEGSGSLSSLELVKKLVAADADVNARMTERVNLTNTRLNTLGATTFLLAAQTADTELMRALVELGADPLLTNADNSTALMVAAGIATRSPGEDAGTEEEVLEAVEVALDLGADIDAVDNHGETAMHGAAYKNLPKVVEFLAERGAKIDVWNRKNEFGWTPLLIAEGYRFGNFKPSPPTVAAIRGAMLSAGVLPPEGPDPNTKSREIY